MHCDAHHLPDESERIVQLVHQALGNRIRRFELVLHRDGWVLRGQTQTYYAKQMVQQLVMRASSHRVAANEVHVI
jgi:hypothetical protein